MASSVSEQGNGTGLGLLASLYPVRGTNFEKQMQRERVRGEMQAFDSWCPHGYLGPEFEAWFFCSVTL